ncbi:MAG TPA: hypothetical protein PLM82_09495 [Candidatus Latescibacteria bacterium]|nr:hypothetical protein [Candidatus Latescibacterota bacterium]
MKNIAVPGPDGAGPSRDMVPGEMFGRRVANAVRTPRSTYRDDGRWGERLRKRVRRFFAASAAQAALRMTRKSQ